MLVRSDFQLETNYSEGEAQPDSGGRAVGDNDADDEDDDDGEELMDYMCMTGATAWLCWAGGEQLTMSHCTMIAMHAWVQDVYVDKDGQQGRFMVWLLKVAP